MSTLFEILQELSQQLPGCRLTSIVSQDTGLTLASVSSGDPLDSAGADAYHSDLYRLLGGALRDLDSAQTPRGVVLTSREAVFISLPLPETGYLWHVVTDRKTTVGFTQAVMRKHASRIEDSIRGLLGDAFF